METFKVYRGKKKIADQVETHMIGPTIADDLHRCFILHMGNANFGKKIEWLMEHDAVTDWEIYPEDFTIPIYTIRKIFTR